jgi:GrpB-like predicted nucleotidyltransferase (UPF0157 family)/predicted enzyme related to lactoylglutathione lyase
MADEQDDVTELRLSVTAPDYDDALAFYRDQLGLREQASYSSPGGRLTILAAGRATLELADPAYAAYIDEVEVGRRVAGPVRVAFEVADTDTVTDRLARAGAEVVAPPTRTPWDSTNARLEGPAGLQLTIWSTAADDGRRSVEEVMAGPEWVTGGPTRIDGPVLLVDPDPTWSETGARLAAEVRSLLGPVAMVVEHAGSTSVPGLADKPVIDLVLAVPDPADEASYVTPLAAAGYALRHREPDWHEHRMLLKPFDPVADPQVNLHVFRIGCVEIDRMLAFRDHLRTDPDDLALYRRTKQGLARRSWALVQQYADAKGPVVEDIVARALRRDVTPVTGVHAVLPAGDDRAGALAAALGVPLLDLAELGVAAGDPTAAARLAAAVCARSPATVVRGDVDATTLPGRVLPIGSDLPVEADALARAVRQLARYPA